MLEAIFFLVIYIFPLHWAAEYSEAEDSNYLKCFILSIIVTIVQVASLTILAGSFFGSWFVSSIISIIICMRVLKIPASNFMMFAVMLAFLNIVVSGSAKLVINGIFGG